MSDFIVAEFHAAPGKLDELVAMLKVALVDTRAFDGCESLDCWLDEERATIIVTERWASFAHYDRYLAWRGETGIFDVVGPLLVGGVAGFVPRHCRPLDC